MRHPLSPPDFEAPLENWESDPNQPDDVMAESDPEVGYFEIEAPYVAIAFWDHYPHGCFYCGPCVIEQRILSRMTDHIINDDLFGKFISCTNCHTPIVWTD